MAVWMVRAGKEGQVEELALREGVIAIGWEEMGDLSGVTSREALRDLVRQKWPNATDGRINSFLGQLWTFRSRIQPGDWGSCC